MLSNLRQLPVMRMTMMTTICRGPVASSTQQALSAPESVSYMQVHDCQAMSFKNDAASGATRQETFLPIGS